MSVHGEPLIQAKYLDGLGDSGTLQESSGIPVPNDIERFNNLSLGGSTTGSREPTPSEGELLRRAAKRLPRDIPTLDQLLTSSQLCQPAKLISKLTEFDEAVRSAVDHLVENIVYRSSEAFEDELAAAESDLAPLLGSRLMSLLTTEAVKAESLNGTKPSRSMVYIASQTLLVGSLCQMVPSNMSSPPTVTPAHSSRVSLLNKFRNMFKIASWALPSTGVRSAFEGHLTRSLHASDDLDRATRSLGGPMANVAPLLGLHLGTTSLKEEKGTHEEIERLQNELRKAQHTNEEYALQLQKIQLQAKSWYEKAKEGQHENHRLYNQVQGTEHELMNMSKRYEDAKSLADSRGKELIGAQVFLNKADSVSIPDLVQKVNGLNEAILQVATSLGEALHFAKQEFSEDAMRETCGLIGHPLAQLIRGEAQTEAFAIPLLVRITIQVYLTAFCAARIQRWAAGEQKIDDYLRTLYGEIRTSNDQAVAGRWRALTRAQLRSNFEDWEGELERDFRAFLAVASWDGATSQRDSFTSKLPAIFRAVEDLKVSLSEKYTSADIEITSIPPGTAFNKAVMEESYGEDTGSPTDVVIATSGLGLSKVVQAQGSDIRYESVLMPKVVLESSLKAVIEPPRPRKMMGRRKNLITKGI